MESIYTLNCTYYTKEFKSIRELIKEVVSSGMDPSYEILKNGVGVGETAEVYIVH